MLDCVIIGGGPGGLAAAVYLARQKLSFALIAKDVGGKPLWSSDVENYLGFHLLSGQELVARFREHLKDYQQQFELVEGESVEKVEKIPGGFRTKTSHAEYESKTLLIATGTKNRQLNVPGEKEFYGKGVTYCATCDAPLYRDKIVYVIGGGNSAMDAALQVEKFATEVKLVTVNAEMAGDLALLQKVTSSTKIKILASTKTTKIVGDGFVTGISLTGPDGVERTEKTDGVFIEIGLSPVSEFIDFVAKDKGGQIIVDKFNATDVAGIFAAGDVTDIAQKQIAVAVGEGCKAALGVIKYLQRAQA